MRDGERIESQRMEARVEARIRLRAIVDIVPGSRIKMKLSAAAESLGWHVRRTEAIYHGEAVHIESWEMDALRAYVPKD